MFDGMGVTYDARVAAGVAFLSERDPQWFNGIRLESLDVYHGRHCVLAQLSNGSWTDGVQKYHVKDASLQANLGFYESPDLQDSRERYAKLTECWRHAIRELRLRDITGISASDRHARAAA